MGTFREENYKRKVKSEVINIWFQYLANSDGIAGTQTL